MPEWENWGVDTTEVPPSIKAPKPSKYVNTPYGPVLRTQLGRGPTFSPATASQFAPGQIVGGYIDSVTLRCVPIIPNPIVTSATTTTSTTTTTTTAVSTKTADTSIFTYAFFDGQPDYAIEAALSLKSLTGNEILQVAHRQNFYTNNAVLNNNILDIVDSKNFYLPTEIIKLQKGNFSYFQNNLTSYSALLTNSVVTVSIPISETEQSYKLQVETFAPNYVKNDTIY
jgi:hypothetical protein